MLGLAAFMPQKYNRDNVASACRAGQPGRAMAVLAAGRSITAGVIAG
jgi:hypothetical protein